MSLSSVGERLKQARVAKKLSVKDVTRETKIQPWALEALEADRLHLTMSPVYAKGFLSTYAKFLRLDPRELVEQFSNSFLTTSQPAEVMGAEHIEPRPQPAPLPRPAASGSSPRGPERQRGTGASSERALEPIAWNVAMGAIWPLLRRLGTIAVAVVGLVVVVKADPLQRLLSRVHPQKASLTVVEKKMSPPTEAALALEPTTPLELAIIAQRPTWVSVKADGHLLAAQQLKPGSKESWKARKRFELIVAKPAQVEVLLNGQPISSLAMAHQGRLVITHKSIRPLADASE